MEECGCLTDMPGWWLAGASVYMRRCQCVYAARSRERVRVYSCERVCECERPGVCPCLRMRGSVSTHECRVCGVCVCVGRCVCVCQQVHVSVSAGVCSRRVLRVCACSLLAQGTTDMQTGISIHVERSPLRGAFGTDVM